MLRTGLVSVTFRALSAADIIKLVAEAKLDGIEWGGDKHVVPGDVAVAKQVHKMTVDAGLEVASYGSYYKAGEYSLDIIPALVTTAKALHAPTIRIWAGRQGSEKAAPEYRKLVADGARALAVAAADEGIAVAFEFHPGTVTDTKASSLAMLAEINHPNIYMYWQSPSDLSFEERYDCLQTFLPRLSNVHVYNTIPGHEPLEADKENWLRYLALLPSSPRTHWAMLEFVKGNLPESFLADGRTLREMAAQLQKA